MAPNGDIHFVPQSSPIGQKVSKDGVVSTYALAYTNASLQLYAGGILTQDGDILFIPIGAPVGQKISTLPAIPFSHAVCCSPYFNKF